MVFFPTAVFNLQLIPCSIFSIINRQIGFIFNFGVSLHVSYFAPHSYSFLYILKHLDHIYNSHFNVITCSSIIFINPEFVSADSFFSWLWIIFSSFAYLIIFYRMLYIVKFMLLHTGFCCIVTYYCTSLLSWG